jgi:hypothetical protein
MQELQFISANFPLHHGKQRKSLRNKIAQVAGTGLEVFPGDTAGPFLPS